MMEKKWEELTPDEKREERFRRWLIPPKINFVNPEAKEAYNVRLKRMADTYRMKIPDRVPVQLPVGLIPLRMAGISLKDAMSDYEKIHQAWSKFLNELEMDVYSGAAILPDKVYDLLDYHLYLYPGHGLPDDAKGFQCVEDEYMKADEYDALILNPSDFWLRTYLPRVFGILEPFSKIQPITSIVEVPTNYLRLLAAPDMLVTLQKLLDVGKQLPKWMDVAMECAREAQEAGIPAPRGVVMAKAPFDTIGDTLRGTRGIFSDIYRQPDKLLEAIDLITSLTIDSTISSVNTSEGIMAMFPLHKGADGFMSDKQFETFYWPSLKKVILALLDEGIMPMLFAEGSYLTRLETVNEFPKGTVVWRFDQTDMATAKKVLGDKCCISGNVPTSLLSAGTPQQVKEYCRKLIEVCAPGGGYILASGAQPDNAPPDNLRAMMEAAKEYGVYK
jgi:uroporphyrinogen-III decarboxylase